tara:strand:+ start:626 stop:2086 length:1461 start_codon:yes stop_codon:yes gene_type:complete
MNKSQSKINKSLFYLFLIVGAFLRVFQFGESPLWADEAFTQYWSKSIFEGEWRWLWQIDFNPPLYYIAQSPFSYFSTDLGLQNEISARLPSLIFEFIFIIFAYRFLKLKENNNIPQIFLILWMVSPSAIEAARTGRGYTLLLLFSFIAWRKIEEILKENQKKKNEKTISAKNKIIFTISATGMLYTHYYGFLILGGLFLYSVSIKKTKEYLLALIPTILLFIPWLPKFMIQLNRGNEMIQDITLTRIPRGLISIFTGQTIFLENFGMENKDLILCIFVTGIMSFLLLKSMNKKNKLLMFEAFSIPFLAMLFSFFGLEIWEEYWFLPGIPAIIILIAKSLQKTNKKNQIKFYPLVLVLSYISLQISYYSHQEWNLAKGTGAKIIFANTPFDIYPLKFVSEGRNEKDYETTYSYYKNERTYGEKIAKKICDESQKNTGNFFISGSFDPVPSGGVIQDLKKCENLKLTEEKIGRRVFVYKYTSVKNQEK